MQEEVENEMDTVDAYYIMNRMHEEERVKGAKLIYNKGREYPGVYNRDNKTRNM